MRIGNPRSASDCWLPSPSGAGSTPDDESVPGPALSCEEPGLIVLGASVPNVILDRLRRVGNTEGVSFLLLLGIAMPLKYLKGLPLGVTVIGSIHGFLWVLYVGVIWQARQAFKWESRTVLYGLAASVLPFGPFIFDAWVRKRYDQRP